MYTSRRSFLGASALGAATAPWLFGQGQTGRWRVGVTDWDIQQTGKLEALEFASRVGFDAVEVSLGRKLVEGRLPLDDAELQARYLAAAAQHRVQISSTCLDALHTYFLKSDKLAPKLLADAIRVSRQLKAPLILTPMFSKGAPSTPAEFDTVGDLLRELGPEAEKAGITLALEDTLSAENNLRIIERSRSKAVKVYYDTGNAANQGYDVIAEPLAGRRGASGAEALLGYDRQHVQSRVTGEIRSLGKQGIGQVHFKDGKSYLGEGKIDFAAAARALADIGYAGFIVLETPSPSGSIEADMRRNLAFVRELIGKTV